MPMIVLEGNDGSGKSSLTQELANVFAMLPMEAGLGPRINIQHVGPPKKIRPEQSIESYSLQERKRIMDMITCYDPFDVNTLFIYDRFHSGSAAYGPLFRKGANVDEFGQLGREFFSEIEDALALRGAITAYLMPSVDTIFDRTAGEEDEFLDDAAGSGSALDAARRELVKAHADLAAAQANGASPAINRCFHQVGRAANELAATQKAANDARRGQLSAIQDRYTALLTEHVDVLSSYLGYPLYAPEEDKQDSWPDVSTSTNKQYVALHLLGEALSRNDTAIVGWTREEFLKVSPLTAIVDEWGETVRVPVLDRKLVTSN